MDFERFKKINDERLNYGEMEDATVVSSYRNTGCGDGYRLYLKINEEDTQKRIIDASYTTTGCGFGLASLAMVTQWVKGKTLSEVEKITAEDIEKEFMFPPRRKNYPESAAQCMRKAVADYHNGSGIPIQEVVTRSMALEKLKTEGNLRNADLRQVILEGEDLSGVDFEAADLSHAYLTNCNLEGAKLFRSKLRGAFLNNANLRGADLRLADIRWAKLTGVDAQDARFDGAIYDVGTRLDPRHAHLYGLMEKGPGVEAFIDKNKQTSEY